MILGPGEDPTLSGIRGNETLGRVPGASTHHRPRLAALDYSTTATTAGPTTTRPHRLHARFDRRNTVAWNFLLGLFALSFAIRLFEISRSYNFFVDEVTYSTISHNLANGNGLSLYGSPFDLHPPVAFAILAVAIRLFHLTSTPLGLSLIHI